jgi:hypothetical protein
MAANQESDLMAAGGRWVGRKKVLRQLRDQATQNSGHSTMGSNSKVMRYLCPSILGGECPKHQRTPKNPTVRGALRPSDISTKCARATMMGQHNSGVQGATHGEDKRKHGGDDALSTLQLRCTPLLLRQS